MIKKEGNLSIDSENIFPIIKKWLYSDQDIYIRELISNGSDAIQKRKKLSMLGEVASDEDVTYKINVVLDPNEKTITVSDNGIGMTADEVEKYITQIAFSGAAEFLEKYKDSGEDTIIGHFGLGFYSAFMVSSLVEIESLSALEGAEAVHWTCDGSSTYEMSEGSRTEVGTDIILHLNEDSENYLDTWEMRKIIEKYCSFMPVPIYLNNIADDKRNEEARIKRNADKQAEYEKKRQEALDKGEEFTEEAPVPEKAYAPSAINDTDPLWLKNPSDCTDEEYKEFYRKVFMDFKEPLFWIHLNMDYPYNLKGILYFPKLGNEFESAEGQVKLYCNQVFVADNVKEIIPEFLLLLKGAIDCPDIPLNVSRSFLQNDQQVKKISEYITRKVADKLKSLYNTARADYETYWNDIHPFIKYGCLRNEKFLERVQDVIIYKSAMTDTYITLPEYLEAAKNTHENKVFYTNDARQQAQYLKVLKDQGYDAVVLNTLIDTSFITLLEQKNEGVKFLRVDADLNEALREDNVTIDANATSTLEELFKKATEKDNLKIRVESLKDPSVSAMIELSEESRRIQDMMKMYGQMGMMMGYPGMEPEETLVLNQKNALVARLLEQPEDETSALIAAHLYDLARLAHEPLEADQLNKFIQRSQEIMGKL